MKKNKKTKTKRKKRNDELMYLLSLNTNVSLNKKFEKNLMSNNSQKKCIRKSKQKVRSSSFPLERPDGYQGVVLDGGFHLALNKRTFLKEAHTYFSCLVKYWICYFK
jgi:hypothetical protein